MRRGRPLQPGRVDAWHFSHVAVQQPSAHRHCEGLPAIHVEGTTDLPGNFYLSWVYSRDIAMLDGAGNVVWSKHEDQPAEGLATGWWDFKKHFVGGKTYYSYHDQTGAYDSFGLEGFAPGEKPLSITLDNPQDFTYRCVYYD